MNLKPKDIYNLDFGRLIYIDGVLYRLNKIIDYSENSLSGVDLLRVNYLQYEAPYYQTYVLGQYLNGGYIVYLDETGQHGLIAPDYNLVDHFPFTWDDAVDYCDTYTVNGYSDWRIGTLDEMIKIDINNAYIPNFFNSLFWTGTESVPTTSAFFIIIAGTGTVYSDSIKTDTRFKLPIKSF